MENYSKFTLQESRIGSINNGKVNNYQKIDLLNHNQLEGLISSYGNYKTKILYILVNEYPQPITPDQKSQLGYLLKLIKTSPIKFKNIFKGFRLVFCNEESKSFVLVVDKYEANEFNSVMSLIKILCANAAIKNLTGEKTEKKNPVKQVTDAKKTDKEIKEKRKEELVDAINNAIEDVDNEEEAINAIDNDEYIRKILLDLEDDMDDGPKLNVARTSRMSKVNDDFLNKVVDGRTVREIITSNSALEIPTSEIKINSINDEWKDMKFVNFEKIYDLHSDIVSILYSMHDKAYPISIRDIKTEDTSTNTDYTYTYTVDIEDSFGKRSSLVFDLPKFKNQRFMRLRGNDKVMSGQLVLLPCTKSDNDTVQLVSFYKKIFIRRKGLMGRSYPSSDRLIKTLRKLTKQSVKGIKIYYGDNSQICNKYELPVDYIDLAANVNRIETKDSVYYFDQDIYRTKFNVNPALGIPYAVNKFDNSIRYYIDDGTLISSRIAYELCQSSEQFYDIYRITKPAEKLNYSEASILAAKIPLIILLGYSLGLKETMKKAGINQWRFTDKRSDYDADEEAIIRFADGYLVYKVNYSSSMLLNGLSVCDTEIYNFGDMEKRSTWLDFLDDFGGRLLSDGLDNFQENFLDPITLDVCKTCHLPTDYFDLLIYSNNMLADNKYIKHTDISGNRFRTNEQIAQLFYQCLCMAYESYKLQLKRGRKVGLTMKKSCVIDAILTNSTTSDLSILNPLLELEASNSVSFKGPSGMNTDRAYGLDKRSYDDSMINKLAMSTGFAANVGINRQATIDMDITGVRGYIKNSTIEDTSVTKALSITEAVTPFGVTRDDPFRTAMTYIQTSKHAMRTKKSMPLLITNGADEAMAYMSSDTFSYKAKEDGEVKEITNEYMAISFKRPVENSMGEIISLKPEVMKCSDGGFYVTIKLDTDLKVGKKFKKGDIIAYDKSSYSNKNGEGDNLAYNLGVLCKVAIMNTDEGFEDSTSISHWLSDAMESSVVTMKDVQLSKNCNIYEMVEIGQPIQEGESLIIYQNAFEEKDANILLKNITDTDYVSDLGRQRVKSKYTGFIQDIKIYRTCEIKDMSESLQKIVKKYDAGIKSMKELYDKYGAAGKNILEPDTMVDQTGKTKNVRDGILIEFYILYTDKMSVGDKLVAQSANKGVVKYIFPDGLEPYSSFRPEESIHALFAARSFNARKVTSVWSSGALNKVLVELDREVKNIMGIKAKSIEDIQ